MMVTEHLETTSSGSSPRLSGPEALRHARQAVDAAIIASGDDPQRWAGDLCAALDELADILRRHRDASERPGGSLEDMARTQPRLVPRLERSREEHEPLIERAEALRVTIAAQMEVGAIAVDRIRQDAGRLQSDIGQHMAAAIDLAYEAYERDMGGEG